MLYFRILASILILFLACPELAWSKCERQNTRELKSFDIDLDKPAYERFAQPTKEFKEGFVNLIESEKKRFSSMIVPLLELAASKLDNYFPYPFNEEIRGIADAIGMNVGDVVLANIIYDFTAYCTSIVAQKADGQIIHGRNLDYDFPEILQNVTYMANFYRGGKLLFKSVHLSGYVGVLTGHKYQQFTFSLNERDQGELIANILFALLDKNATPLAFLTRQVMENATSFGEAVNILRTHDMIAPVYFIVGGVNEYEGVVITRNQIRTIDTWTLNANSTGIESWYLLETNYDHWLPPPSDDNRRTPGMKLMNQTTQANINSDTLMDVISTNPVCNKETVYSTVMSAAEEDIQVLIH